MIKSRFLMIICIITSILNSIFLYYFKFSPIIFSKTITDLLFLLLFLVFFILLIYGAFLIERSKELLYLMSQYLIITFTVRMIPNLRLSYPPLHDTYFYIISVINIIDFGTLTPNLLNWYSQSSTGLHWPSLHILASEIILLSNIDIFQIMRYFNPLMGCIFLISVFLFSYEITSDLKTSLIASLLASMADVCIFYQSEYHPQGYSIILLMFIMCLFFMSKQRRSTINNSLLLLFIISFISTHHFSSLFLALLFSEILVFVVIVKYIFHCDRLKNIFPDLEKNLPLKINLVMFIVVFSFSYHFYIYPRVIENFIVSATNIPPLNTGLVNIGKSVPLYATIISLSKWIVLLLASISVINIIHKKETHKFMLLIIFIGIIFAGVLGNYVFNSPLDRIILFYTPIASVLAASTINKFYLSFFQRKAFKFFFLAFIGLILTTGVLNSQSPCYFFENSNVNTYYWYSNKLPNMDSYVKSGYWIENYTNNYSKYGTEFDTYIIPYFYAQRSPNNISFINNYDNIMNNYFIYNPSIPYLQGESVMNKRLLSKYQKIYDNSEIDINI